MKYSLISTFYSQFGFSLADKLMKVSSASGQLISVVTLLVSLLTAKVLT